MRKIVYISGPLHERVEFRVAEDYIFARGDIPLSVEQLDGSLGMADVTQMCDEMIKSADIVYMLRDWEQSEASFERVKALIAHKEIEYQ